MKSLIFLTAVILLSGAHAQYEAGFVKIIEDQRFQDGALFGNYRNQEDGIKYKEETDAHGIRRGFWEYPDSNGKIARVEFEAGPGIGFRIVSSNIVAPTPVANPRTPQLAVAPLPVQRQPQAVEAPVIVQHQPARAGRPVVVQPRIASVMRPAAVVVTPGPQRLFDYPANLEFFRDATGHRFRFSAV